MKQKIIPNGAAHVLAVAYPIMISQGTQGLMIFCDRLILSWTDRIAPAAALAGGLQFHISLMFFIGLCSYTTTMSGQYFGAGKPKTSARAAMQGLYIILPAVIWELVFSLWLAPYPFKWAGLSGTHRQLALDYLQVLAIATPFVLAKVCLAGLFSGLEETKVVMRSHLIGLMLNIPLTYILVHGAFGLPSFGIVGAGIGTIVSETLIVGILFFNLFGKKFAHLEPKKAWSFHRTLFKDLLRYGAPTGVELSLTFLALHIYILLFQSYGPGPAATVTIVLNWDVLSFLPMLGMHVAVMSLVGQNMGRGDPEGAKKVLISAAKVSFSYIAILSLAFFLIGPVLIRVFLPGQSDLDAQILALGVPMLKWVSLYLFGDASYLLLSGALRGSGDTRWCMMASIFMHWLMLAVSIYLMRYLEVRPLYAWYTFVALIMSQGPVFLLRYKTGIWEKNRLVRDL